MAPGLIMPDDAATDVSSDDEKYSDSDDRDVLRPTSHSLGIVRSYVPTWSREDAFRELYQNWKDAIIVTFQLSQRSFKTELKESKDEIHILVHHPSSVEPNNPIQKRLLGYIRFKVKRGSVELTNFQAQLTRRNLELGGSTKRGNNAVAGTHGEGLKVAALVLRRNEHRVRLTSNGYNWTFGFRGTYSSNLFCRLTPVPDRQMLAARETSRDLKADPATDVSILIDKARGGKAVSEEDFRRWITVTLDIDRPKDPSNIVETTHGDLILEDRFAGKMYLKGLLLPSGGSRIKTQYVGYNLLQGHTNRDRERLKNEEEEAQTLTHVWEDAIAKCGDKILQRYIDLLQYHHDCVDVSRAERLISQKTAEAIWERLKSQANDKFYYHREDSDSNVDIIKKHLKQQPSPLSSKLWKILRKFSLIRTPHEERIHLFRNSSLSEKPVTMFSKSIQHGLKASLALHTRTQQVQVIYVTGAETDIDMLFEKEQQVLRVHEKWLDFAQIHETAPCRISVLSTRRVPDSVFFCDHVIEEIYELAVHEIIESLTMNQGDALAFVRSMRLRVREKLQQMPRMALIKPSDEPLELVVTWADGESELVREALSNVDAYSVTLHREETCSQKQSDCLYRPQPRNEHPENMSTTIDATCVCRRVVVSQTSRRAVFSNLDPGERYFPMIAREEEFSFYGLPPEALRPLAQRPGDSGGSMHAARHNGGPEDIPFEGPSYNMIYSDDDDDNMLPVDAEERPQQRNETGPIARSARATIVQPQPGTESGARVTDQTSQHNHDHSRWEQEQEQIWSTWEKENLQTTFDQFFSPRNLCALDLPSVANLALPQLGGYRFEINEYVQVRLRQTSATIETTECVVSVHRILYNIVNEQIQFYLLVSRYEFLESSHPFSSANEMVGQMNRKELILHFTDYDTMGAEQDAEIIPVNEIIEARNLEYGPGPNAKPIQWVAHAPTDTTGFYCRFAIRGKNGKDSACITPINSNLLTHYAPWKLPVYSGLAKPLIIDFSPPALGLSEGFHQEGCHIAAGLGFSTIHDMTWKARYHSAEIYDGIAEDVLVQITNGQLPYPEWLKSDTVKVAVIGTKGSEVDHHNKDETLQNIINAPLHALRTVQSIVTNSVQDRKYFDFLVCVLPAVTLHQQILPVLIRTVYTLLEKRYSIHIEKVYLPNHGILVDKTLIVLLASPICGGPRWDWNQPDILHETLESVIGDLAFQNPRKNLANNLDGYSLICRKTSSTTDEMIYNHTTGSSPIPGAACPVVMDATALKPPLFRAPFFVHPTRNDLLSIREMARIYGFPDDFVFYDGPEGSYHYFSQAVPPIVSRIVARGIRGIFDQCRGWELGESSMDGILRDRVRNKRPRVD